MPSGDGVVVGGAIIFFIFVIGFVMIYNSILDSEERKVFLELISIQKNTSDYMNLVFDKEQLLVSLSNECLDGLELKTGNVYMLNLTRKQRTIGLNEDWQIVGMKMIGIGNSTR